MPSAVHQLVNSKRDLDLIACSSLESSTFIIEPEDTREHNVIALRSVPHSPFTSPRKYFNFNFSATLPKIIILKTFLYSSP